MTYRFIDTERVSHRVAVLCRVLRVSRSGFYAWLTRSPSDREIADGLLAALIAQIHRESDGTYGTPRIHAALRRRGVLVSRRRVARLMRQQGLEGVSRRRRRKTTVRNPAEAKAPDLVGRDFFAVEGPNRLWLADITYVPTWQGYLYLAIVEDTWSRRIIGWAMRSTLEAELVVDAVGMAITNRRPGPGVIHHSDAGSQGGFKWSSQHLLVGVTRDGCSGASAGGSRDAWSDLVAGPAVDRAAGGSSAVLAGDCGRLVERGCGRRGGGVAGGWQPVVSRRWRDAANLVGPAVGALSLVF